MDIPFELFVKTLSCGKIYYFQSEYLNTPVPHYFIVLHVSQEEVIYLACSTTQFEKRKKHLDKNAIPYSTLVPILPDSGNCFTQESYIDCNSYFEYSTMDFYQKHLRKEITPIGEISMSHLKQIYEGIKASPLLEQDIKSIIYKNV